MPLAAIIGFVLASPPVGRDVVTLLGVYDIASHRAWTGSGRTMPYKEAPGFPGMFEMGGNKPRANPNNILHVVVQIKRPKRSDSPSVAFKLPSTADTVSASWIYYDPVSEHDPAYWTAALAKPFRETQSDVAVGVADSKWSRVGLYRLRRSRPVYASGVKFGPKITVRLTPGGKPVKEPDGGIRQTGMEINVALPPSIAAKAFRIVAYDRNGKELDSGGHMTLPNRKLPSQYYFVGTLSALSRIELQTRPYAWTTFKQVSLRPQN